MNSRKTAAFKLTICSEVAILYKTRDESDYETAGAFCGTITITLETMAMASHKATVAWQCPTEQPFTDGRFSRVHQWEFDGGAVIKASPSPEVLRAPMSDPAGVDPEEAFVASLSSCHMMFFLMFAAKAKCAVASYKDDASGVLSKREDGRVWMSEVTLRPHVVFTGEKTPCETDVDSWHHAAHEACYIGNSVLTNVTINGTHEVV